MKSLQISQTSRTKYKAQKTRDYKKQEMTTRDYKKQEMTNTETETQTYRQDTDTRLNEKTITS